MVSSLFHIASKKVAECIDNGSFNQLNYVLDSKSSNEVYRHLLKMDNCFSYEISKQVENGFNLTKIDFGEYRINRNVVEMLKIQCLESLVLGNLSEIGGLFRDKNGECAIDIVSLLMSVLNQECRESLQYLDIKGQQSFSKGWTENIGKMFPSLRSLNVSGRHFNGNEFSQLCINFPNLVSLDISSTDINDISWISQLKNLQILSIRDLKFDNFFSFIDLFRLKQLRVLDISRSRFNPNDNVINQFLACKKSLPELRFLDCSGTDINEELLEKLVKSHPNLQQIAAMNCALQYSVIPSVDLLNSGTFPSVIKLLTYFMKLKRTNEITWCLDRIYQFICNETRLNLSECVKEVCHVMSEFPYVDHIQMPGISCLILISHIHLKSLRPFECLMILNQLLDSMDFLPDIETDFELSWNRSFWEAIGKITELGSLNFNYEKICQKSMKFLTKVDFQNGIPTPMIFILWKFFGKIDVEKFSEKSENTNKLMEILKFSTTLDCPQPFGLTLDILSQMSSNSEEASKNIIENGGISQLFDCLEKINITWVQSKILEILKELAFDSSDYNQLEEFYIDKYFSILLQMVDGADVDKAFNAISIISLLLYLSENVGIKCRMGPAANQVISIFYQKFPISPISNHLVRDVLLDTDLLSKVISTSTDDAPILWIFMIVKKIVQQNEGTIFKRRESKLYFSLKNLQVESEIVMKMKEEVIDLLD